MTNSNDKVGDPDYEARRAAFMARMNRISKGGETGGGAPVDERSAFLARMDGKKAKSGNTSGIVQDREFSSDDQSYEARRARFIRRMNEAEELEHGPDRGGPCGPGF